METDIPFMIGEDKYSIKSIWISESTFEYGVGSTDEDTVIEYGNEVMIKVEPVNIEENTRVMMIKASVGTEKERLVQVFKSSTGETELKNLGYEFNVIETNAFGQYFFDKNYEPTEIVLKFGFQKDENIPEELILRIDQVGKIWDQNYYFELD